MGEQGAESIHAYFNSLGRQYQTTKDLVVKLNTMMKEHLTHMCLKMSQQDLRLPKGENQTLPPDLAS